MPVPKKYRDGTNGVYGNGTNGVYGNGTNGVYRNGTKGVNGNGTNIILSSPIPPGDQYSRTSRISGGVYGIIVIAIGWVIINVVLIFIVRRRRPTQRALEEALEKDTQEKHELSSEEKKIPEFPENNVWELPGESAVLELHSMSVQELEANPTNVPKRAIVEKRT
jgi:hypothetical protein